MYLSDRDLRQVLGEIRFEVSDPSTPFVPDEQIQPCSVDLRLDNVFWKQRRRRTIDLRRAKLLELSPRRHWSKFILSPGECITLKPGQMILGRTYEAFTIPRGCAGKLEGRSSFARMGLAVHCSADFINPGYRGKMPLELVNFGRSSIRIFPRLPICQLMLVRLTSEPLHVYGARELSSKYMDDDGGPSYWWRDKRIQALQRTMGEHDVGERIQSEVLDVIGPCEPELIERFERFVQRTPKDQLGNAEEVLERFAGAEGWSHRWRCLWVGLCRSLAPVLLAASVGSLFSQPFGWNQYGWIHYLLWGAALAAIPVTIAALTATTSGYMDPQTLERAREDLTRSRAASPAGGVVGPREG